MTRQIGITREMFERAREFERSGGVSKAVLEPVSAERIAEIERTEPPEQEVKRILRKIHRMTDESILDKIEFEDKRHTVYMVSCLEFELGEIKRLIGVYEKWNESPE